MCTLPRSGLKAYPMDQEVTEFHWILEWTQDCIILPSKNIFHILNSTFVVKIQAYQKS